MNDALGKMLEKYPLNNLEDHLFALREILQEIALLGLWRSKFFDKAAFYGGTALRILHGLDRFSEDLNFSLRKPMADFDFKSHLDALQKEIAAFGFDMRVESPSKPAQSQIRSAVLKANTISQLLVIQTPEEILRRLHRERVLIIKLEVDTEPPQGFETETRYLLHPIAFAVRAYTLPDLFAGKMHAILCRRWKNRSKGRDWYDLVWYAANHPRLHLSHLEQRMRQSGDWSGPAPLPPTDFKQRIRSAIDHLDINQIRTEVEPFAKQPAQLEVWSHNFFHDIVDRIVIM